MNPPLSEHGLARERIAGRFVILVMILACTVFWVGIPLGCLWLLGELTDSVTTHFVGAVVGIPFVMILITPLLFWLNGLYLRVSGVARRLAEDEDDADWRRRVRGPLEPILLISLAVELALLFFWFFVLAKNPSISVL